MPDHSATPNSLQSSNSVGQSKLVLLLTIYTLIGGAISFIGWPANIPRLADWDGDGIAIQPNAAIAVVGAGAALLLLSFGFRRIAAALGALVAFIGCSVLFEYLSGIQLGIDDLLMFGRTWGRVGVLFPGRMGPPGAASWTLIGITLALTALSDTSEVARGRFRAKALVPILGLLTASISTLSLIGYLYGASRLYTIPTITVIAFQTATFILADSVALVMTAPEYAPVRLITENSAAGVLARRILPAVIGLPILIGFLRMSGDRWGLYDLAFGSAIRTVVEMACFVALLWWTSNAISRQDKRRKQAEAQIHEQARLLDLGSDAIILTKWNNGILYWNRGAEELYGFTRDEAFGKRLHELLQSEFPEPHAEIIGKLKREGVWSGEVVHTASNGHRLTLAARWVLDRDAEGKPRTILKGFNDITERKRTEEALRESQSRLSGLIDSAMDAVITVDAEQRIVLFNPAAERMFGCIASDIVGDSLDRFIPLELREIHRSHIEEFGSTGITTRRMGALGALLGVRSNGDEFPIEASISHMIVGGQKLFTVILRDITERKAAEVEREGLLGREHELRAAAEEANRLKDEFLAIMSHELRNPLNVILGYSELLVRNDEITQSAQLQRMAEAIKRNAISQSKLIRDLLDLSRLRSGKLELNREIVSMMVSVNNAIDTVRSDAEAKQLTIEIDAPDESLFVEGDPVRLEQIIWNLLNNSVKFTQSGGKVAVRLGKERDQVFLTVEDTGQGIDASFLPHIFEIFRQADPGTNRAHSGMGIGLAVVKQLVDLHHGSITAHSAGLGKGATFTVKLPLSLEIRLEPAHVVDLTTTLEKFAVLVVDDSEDTTDMLAQILKMSGAMVSSAISGDEALRMIANKEFDVILSDISMPGMDGFEFLRKLRLLPKGTDVPVLALTGFGRPEDIDRAKSEGFFSHVTKPFDIDALIKTLRAIPRRKPD